MVSRLNYIHLIHAVVPHCPTRNGNAPAPPTAPLRCAPGPHMAQGLPHPAQTPSGVPDNMWSASPYVVRVHVVRVPCTRRFRGPFCQPLHANGFGFVSLHANGFVSLNASLAGLAGTLADDAAFELKRPLCIPAIPPAKPADPPPCAPPLTPTPNPCIPPIV